MCSLRFLMPSQVGCFGYTNVLRQKYQVVDYSFTLQLLQILATAVLAGIVDDGQNVRVVRVLNDRRNRLAGKFQPVKSDHANVDEHGADFRPLTCFNRLRFRLG